MSDLKFVTIQTKNHDDRNVTLSYGGNGAWNEVKLLGELAHGTQIVINQKLVDDLQKIVDFYKESENEL